MWVFENDRDGLGAIYRSLRHLPSLQKSLLSQDIEVLYRSLHPEVTFLIFALIRALGLILNVKKNICLIGIKIITTYSFQ